MEEKLEEVVEETTPIQNQGDPGDENTTKFESEGNPNVTKVDLRKNLGNTDQERTITKVDLSKPPAAKEDEVVESGTDNSEVVTELKDNDAPQTQEEAKPQEEIPAVEEVTGQAPAENQKEYEVVEKAVAENEATGKPLPENIQKLMDFMNDTGGDLNDYVRLNDDFSNYSDTDLMREYYYKTKPHLTNEEINFLMEDEFSYNEDSDEERDIRRKKLALKEQVASAKSHLDGLKSKYYEDIKAGSKLTGEQQKAVDFFDRYKVNTEQSKKNNETLRQNFTTKTNEVFNENFKGFEYNVGDKKFRFNVNNSDDVKMKNADVNKFVGKFLDEKTGALKDGAGYHKSLFTAMNADSIANHFYEQGRADALKNSVATSKNISMNPRQQHSAAQTNGPRVRVIDNDQATFKFKKKNK